MTIKRAAVVLLIFFATACTNHEKADPASDKNATPPSAIEDTTTYTGQWNEKDRDTFMTKCIDGSKGKMTEAKANAYCTCMLQKLQVKYPVADSANNISLAEMVQLAKDCLK